MDNKRVPDILIEQYALGELSPEKAREVEDSPGFADRLAEIEASNQRILTAYPAATFARRIENRSEVAPAAPARRRVGFTLNLIRFGIPAAALVAVALIVGLQLGSSTPIGPEGAEIVRLKGSAPRIYVYRSVPGAATAANNVERLDNGAVAHTGDRLQLAYVAGEYGYGAIVSVDGRGVVTLHYPSSTDGFDPAVQSGGETRLDLAYQLDDAPAFERFLFFASDERFSVQALVQQIRSQAAAIVQNPNAAIHVDGDFATDSILLRKGEIR